MSNTPDDLLATINNLESPPLPDATAQDDRKHAATQLVLYYLLRRTIFLEGLKHGEAHRPEWYRGFGTLFAEADRLGDVGVFQALAGAKQKRESKKPRPGWGLLRYRILIAWLAGGLWRLPNDGERCKALNNLWQDSGSEKATEENFKRTRQKLGL